MGVHGLRDWNDNGERFVNLCNAYRLVIGGTLFLNTMPTKSSVGCHLKGREHTTRLTTLLLAVALKVASWMVRDRHLMIALIRLRTASVSSNRTNKLITLRYNANRLRDTVVNQQFKEHLSLGAALRRQMWVTSSMLWQMFLQPGTWRRIEERILL